MNSLKKAFGTSKVREEEGTWVDVTDEISIKVRRFSSRASKESMKRFEKEFANVGKKKLKQEEVEDLVTRTMADAIIVDWKGVTGDDDKELECSYENKLAILTDPEMSDFRDFVASQANSRDTFAKSLEEDAVGN